MSRVPLIDSPCPLRASTMPSAGRDHCGHCDRQVHNLDGMSSSQREAFLKSCTGKVCVAYTVHRQAQRRNAVMGATLVASLAGSGMAMAQQAPAPTPQPQPQAASNTQLISPEQVESTTILDSKQIASVMLGGISDANAVRWVDQSDLDAHEQQALPEIGELEWLPSKPKP